MTDDEREGADASANVDGKVVIGTRVRKWGSLEAVYRNPVVIVSFTHLAGDGLALAAVGTRVVGGGERGAQGA